MSDHSVSRRKVLVQLSVGAGAMWLTAPILGCAKKASTLKCDDLTGLTPADASQRQSLAYVDASPHADKQCVACQFFQAPPKANSCGACTLVKGPISPKGYCNSFVVKQG